MTDADTNQIIAEAMGWKFVDHHPQGRTCKHSAFHPGRYGWHQNPDELELWSCAHCQESSAPDYLHDANALVEAAEKLSPGYTVQHSLSDGYRATSGDADHVCRDMKFTSVLHAMILAVLAERKDAKP